MNSEAMKNLPPEMQQRLAEIMQQQQAAAGVTPTPQAPVATPAPIVKPPSLMDHLIALRGEVAEMSKEVGAMRQEKANLGATVEANSNVVEAVGLATGLIYQMFLQSPTQGGTYSLIFQQVHVDDREDYC